MAILNLDNLQRKVEHLLEIYRTTCEERDELVARVSRVEAELEEAKHRNGKSNPGGPDAAATELILAKVDELLAKLEGF